MRLAITNSELKRVQSYRRCISLEHGLGEIYTKLLRWQSLRALVVEWAPLVLERHQTLLRRRRADDRLAHSERI